MRNLCILKIKIKMFLGTVIWICLFLKCTCLTRFTRQSTLRDLIIIIILPSQPLLPPPPLSPTIPPLPTFNVQQKMNRETVPSVTDAVSCTLHWAHLRQSGWEHQNDFFLKEICQQNITTVKEWPTWGYFNRLVQSAASSRTQYL